MSKAARRAIAAATALAAWGVFLLDFTYLEPLRWGAAELGVVLLLVAALGAGLVSGWSWWTLLLIPAAGIGVAHPSDAFLVAGWKFLSDEPQDANDAIYLLSLLPVAIVLGAMLSRATYRAPVVGAVLLSLPLAIVAWAGFRSARPIDREPAHPITLSYPRYRSVALRDRLPKVLSELGQPDRRSEGIDLTYGRDTFELTPSSLDFSAPRGRYFLVMVRISDPRAETAEGVGIGDNLSLVEARLAKPGVPPIFCSHDSAYKPECTVYFDTSGLKSMTFTGNPIERITME